MRIAVSGAHATGKTTLIAELSRLLPALETLEEPYLQLEEEGHAFESMPSLRDFELQLERSLDSILESDGDCIFDRCPLDFLAYLLTHADASRFELDRWFSQVEQAMGRLTFVVFVPIEVPDRISVPASEDVLLRQRVHEELQSILLDDPWSLDLPVVEVQGTPSERAGQVLAWMDRRMPSRQG